MNSTSEVDHQELIKSYLEKSLPFQWVDWWFEMPEGGEKDQLSSILFENGRLRVLVDPMIRENVLLFVERSSIFRRLILDAANKMLDEIVVAANEDISKDSGLGERSD